MITIDHLSLGVADVPAARIFYETLLSTLDISCLAEGEGFAAFGRAHVEFLLLSPFDGRPASAGNGAYVAFAAPSREAVAGAHAAGLEAGATDEGAPGVRAAYPMPDVFAAYLRDPWGNKLEIVQIGAGARILIVGQATGRRTHLAGRPFDDASGVRLRYWLSLDETTFHDPAKAAILPMGFCYPGAGRSGDLPPRIECAPLWRKRVLEALVAVRLTVVIGRHAQAWHLPGTINLSLAEAMQDWRARWPEASLLPHPSLRNAGWFQRNAWFETELLPVLRAQVARLLGDLSF